MENIPRPPLSAWFRFIRQIIQTGNVETLTSVILTIPPETIPHILIMSNMLLYPSDAMRNAMHTATFWMLGDDGRHSNIVSAFRRGNHVYLCDIIPILATDFPEHFLFLKGLYEDEYPMINNNMKVALRDSLERAESTFWDNNSVSDAESFTT